MKTAAAYSCILNILCTCGICLNTSKKNEVGCPGAGSRKRLSMFTFIAPFKTRPQLFKMIVCRLLRWREIVRVVYFP